eukprot:8341108-Alexandrium_andersonii.AAC.1
MMPLPGLPSMTSSTARMLRSAEAWAAGGLAARVQGWRTRPLVRTWTSRLGLRRTTRTNTTRVRGTLPEEMVQARLPWAERPVASRPAHDAW